MLPVFSYYIYVEDYVPLLFLMLLLFRFTKFINYTIDLCIIKIFREIIGTNNYTIFMI
nr:MAG TPA: hypothetical protein [Caudoviricetes sp.]